MRKFKVLSFSNIFLWMLTLSSNFLISYPKRRFGKPPNYKSVPQTSFSCEGRAGGYYADIEAQCQAYHMCDGLRQFSFLCPRYTLFNQKFMVCDHFVAMDCSQSEKYYHLNLNIGKVPKKRQKKKSNNLSKIKMQNNRISRANQIKIESPENSINRSPFKNISVSNLTPKRNLLPVTKKFNQSKSIPPTPRLTSSRSLFGQSRIPPRTSSGIKKNIMNIKKPKFSFSSIPKKVFQPKTTVAPKSTISRSKLRPNSVPTINKSRFRSSSGISHPFSSNPPSRNKVSNTLTSNPKQEMKIFTIGGRGKKVRFKVAKAKNGAFKHKGKKLRPILVRRKQSFVDNRSFTVATDVLATTPSFDSSDEEDDESSTSSPRAFAPINDILITPPLQSSGRLPEVSQFLIPPFNTPVVLHAENQEIRTPLTISNNLQQSFLQNSKSRSLDTTVSRTSFGTTGANPDFFIPDHGLIPPFPGNHLENSFREDVINDHRMTMTFTDKGGNTRTFLFPVNPNCPNCHPAFLRPNQCRPCVIIK